MSYFYRVSFDLQPEQMDEVEIGSSLARVLGYLPLAGRAWLSHFPGDVFPGYPRAGAPGLGKRVGKLG
jgi:hypothetical protein